MGLEKLEFVFLPGIISAEQICSSILSVLKSHGLLTNIAMLYGEEVSTGKLTNRIRKSKGKAFQLEIGDLDFHFVSVRAFCHDLLEIREKKPSTLSWDEWVSSFPAGALIQAWVSDIDYVRWQNAEDPLEYEAAGKSISGLPMRSNELPPPLEKMVVDVSGNPSRRILRVGYVEAIGGTMWLTKRFFQAVENCNVNRIKSVEWLKTVESHDRELLRIQAAGGVFRDSSTEQIQRNLREILFSSE